MRDSQNRWSEKRIYAYLWSHIYPIAIYAITSLLICLVRFVSFTESYESSDLSIPFNESKNPFYAAHVSDLHHTNIRPDRMIQNLRKLGNITYRFNPPVFSFGGDLVDALNSTNVLSFHKQYEINWHRYSTARIEADIFDDNRTVFEIAGNHDMMVVSQDNNVKNRYRYYTMKENDPLAVRSYQFDDEYSVPINVVLFNIIRPPFTSGPLGVFPCTHNDDVQILEDNIKRGYKNIIICHFPFSHWWSLSPTRNGNYIRDVGRMSNMILTGHLHPSTNVIERKKNTLSVICTALFESSVFSMAFVDNGGSGVQPVDTADPNDVVLITYPLNKNQLTSRSVFNLNTFPIRAYQFSPTVNNLTAYIDGKSVGHMKYLRTTRRHVHFYSLNVTVEDGDHTLMIGSTVVNFFVGDTIPGTIEIGNNNLYSPEICIFGAFRTLFFLVLLLVPLWKIECLIDVIKRYQNYIFGISEVNQYGDVTETDYKWYQQIFLGPLYLITRARFLPSNFYKLFWAVSLIFLVCPMYMMQDDEYLAIVFVWGAYIHNTFSQYAMCFTLWLIHLFFFCQGSLVTVSFWYEVKEKFTTAQWIEFAFYIIFTLVGPIGWYILAYLAGGFFTILAAPITWVQIAATAYLIYWIRNESKNKKNMEDGDLESEISYGLTSNEQIIVY